MLGGIQAKYFGTQHNNTNCRVTITGPDTAVATTYASNYHKKTEAHGGGRFDYHGVYEDELVKTGRFSHVISAAMRRTCARALARIPHLEPFYAIRCGLADRFAEAVPTLH